MWGQKRLCPEWGRGREAGGQARGGTLPDKGAAFFTLIDVD